MDEVRVELPNTLTVEEWRCLEVFKCRAAELGAATMLTVGPGPKATLTANAEVGFKVEVAEMPDEDVLRSFLMSFRMFHHKNEPSRFPRVVNILYKHTESDALRNYLARLREAWQGALFGSAMFLHIETGVVDAVAELFPDSRAVNEALRTLARFARVTPHPKVRHQRTA